MSMTPLRLRAATAALLIACALALLRPALRLRCFRDENESVQVALNLITHLQYGLILSKPNFDAFYPEMSIGILSNWPAALGWGLGGTMLAARLAVSAYCLLLSVVLGYGFTRALVPSWRPLALPLSLVCFLLALALVPMLPHVIVHALGEFSGGLFLAFGYLLLPTHPGAAALVLGLCVWHTKFIYAPFALLGVAYSVCRAGRAAGARLRLLGTQLALFSMPLAVWIALVRTQTGAVGLTEWLQRRLHWYQVGHYSGLGSPLHVSGLLDRLASPRLEWAHYSTGAKLKVLALLLLPCAVLLREIIRRWRSQRPDRSLDLLQAGLCAGLLATAWWYFFLHTYMWLRHLVPALVVGFGVLLYFASTWAARLPDRQQAWLAAVLCLGLAIDGVPAWPETVRLVARSGAPHTFALKCRSHDPWHAGPWPREACWEPTSPDWP